jgi:hypothetical protein
MARTEAADSYALLSDARMKHSTADDQKQNQAGDNLVFSFLVLPARLRPGLLNMTANKRRAASERVGSYASWDEQVLRLTGESGFGLHMGIVLTSICNVQNTSPRALSRKLALLGLCH